MISKQWTIKSLADLDVVSAEFWDFAGKYSVFALNGNMGVGKTTFVKALAKFLGIKDDVSSPTFAIVNEYCLTNGKSFYHFDFYRVKSIEEALDFGIEEYLYSGNPCFMEWPDKIADLLPETGVVNCNFSEKNDGERILEVILPA